MHRQSIPSANVFCRKSSSLAYPGRVGMGAGAGAGASAGTGAGTGAGLMRVCVDQIFILCATPPSLLPQIAQLAIGRSI